MTSANAREKSQRDNDKPYIGRAFLRDCDTFYNEYVSLNTIRYKPFADTWQQLHFSFVYYRRVNSENDQANEYVDETFAVAKTYFFAQIALRPKFFGFYLMYGLFFKQPTQPPRQIRVTHAEYQDLLVFYDKIRREKQYDTMLIWHKLVCADAFKFVKNARIFAPEKRFRKYFDPTFEANVSLPVIANRSIATLNASQLVPALKLLDEKYRDSLRQLYVCVDTCGEDFHKTVDAALNGVTTGKTVTPKESGQDDEKPSETIGKRRRKLIDDQFRNKES